MMSEATEPDGIWVCTCGYEDENEGDFIDHLRKEHGIRRTLD